MAKKDKSGFISDTIEFILEFIFDVSGLIFDTV